MKGYEYQVEQRLDTEIDFSSTTAYRAQAVKPNRKVRLRSSILVDTIHDGYVLPGLLAEAMEASQRAGDDRYQAAFFEQRDWGAGPVAAAVAAKLGLAEFRENVVARSVLDFNRFPGLNRSQSPHLEKLAISGQLVQDILEAPRCAETLIKWYQDISEGLEVVVRTVLSRGKDNTQTSSNDILQSRFIRLSIHTFDRKGSKTGHRRPKVSIVHRSSAIEQTGQLPAHAFHHLYPAELATFTADRMLKSALSCGFETNFIPEHSDSPYMHPEGGVEMRLQAWLWFRYLRMIFEERRPEEAERLRKLSKGTEEGTAYEAYWRSVTNLNALHPLTHLVRAFVDQRVVDEEVIVNADGKLVSLKDIWTIEQKLVKFYDEERSAPDAIDGEPRFVRSYQYAPFRPSALVIEIRKDELFEEYCPKEGIARGLRYEFIEKIARSVLSGLQMYEELLKIKESNASEDCGSGF